MDSTMDFNEYGRYWCVHESTLVAFDHQVGGTRLIPVIFQMIWQITRTIQNGRFFFGDAILYVNGQGKRYGMHGVINKGCVSIQLLPHDDHEHSNVHFQGHVSLPSISVGGGGYPVFHLTSCGPRHMYNVDMIPRSVLLEDRVPGIGMLFSETGVVE